MHDLRLRRRETGLGSLPTPQRVGSHFRRVILNFLPKLVLTGSLLVPASLFGGIAKASESSTEIIEGHNNHRETKMITISGTVTGKDGQPVEKCDVFFNRETWITEESFRAQCDENGRYEIQIEPGHYNSIYICDEELYAKTRLEFWGWNVSFSEDQTLNAAFDTIEVFSLSTWAANGGSSSVFAAFRPMALHNAKPPKYYNQTVAGKNYAILDIAPSIDESSIRASIDGNPIKLRSYHWAFEKINCNESFGGLDQSHGCYMPMIIAQFDKPALEAGDHIFTLRVVDADTQNLGEGITQFTSNNAGYGF